MCSRLRFAARLLVLCCAAGAVSAGQGRGQATVVSDGAAAGSAPAASSLMPEVRLRKLHLVRPDLILYPIAYEVYC